MTIHEAQVSEQVEVPVLELPDESNLTQAERDYLFDLRGCRIIRNALSQEDLKQVNAYVDSHEPLDRFKKGDWLGDVEIHRYGNSDGVNFQNIIEGGPVFERLIDHPAWLDQVHRYIHNGQHQLSLDENFLNVRESGGFIPIHSGAQTPRFTSVFKASHQEGKWCVGQINILMALKDIGPGDGATTVIPGSHKSHLTHPQMMQENFWGKGVNATQTAGMYQVHLNAGDALMFTDAITHGSMPRTNPGQRRIMVYRYAPNLLANRYNYIPSEELMARLTPERRRIVQPKPPRGRPGRVLTFSELPEAWG
jgi:hypothetical protein